LRERIWNIERNAEVKLLEFQENLFMKGAAMIKRELPLLSFLLATALIVFGAVSVNAELGPEAWLGIYTQTVDNDLKEAFDLDREYGVIVKMVVPGSPADEAGLRQSDIILRFDGHKLTDSDELIRYMRRQKPGDEVTIDVVRKGEEKSVAVVLGTRDDDRDLDKDMMKNLPPTLSYYDKSLNLYRSSLSDSYIGVTLENLNYQLGEYFGVKDGKGALITEVMDDSPATKAGLKAGDVIIEIDGTEVDEPSDVREGVREKEEGESLDLKVLRNRDEMAFSIEVESSPDDFLWHGTVPDFDEDLFVLPRMKGLFRGTFDEDLPDAVEMKEWMKELEEEMEELREELRELRKKLE
jgi:membrane-associated protease RseP (regulator of RpoE activity)